MPLLDFFRRSKAEPAAGRAAAPQAEPGMQFDCCTEDWRIRGRVTAPGRLIDSLNRREALEIIEAEWAPLDGSADFQPVPGLKTVDPYDVLIVFATADTMPGRTADAALAHRRTKEMYDVILEVPPFHVVGTIHLYPGLEPATLLDHATNLFVAITGGVALLGEVRVGPDEPTTILVNRSYLTRVHQVEDARRHQAGIAAAAAAAAELSPAPEPAPEASGATSAAAQTPEADAGMPKVDAAVAPDAERPEADAAAVPEPPPEASAATTATAEELVDGTAGGAV